MERKMNNNFESQNKNNARTVAVRYRGRTYKVALYMPSRLCLDLVESMANKSIRKGTFLVIVEYNAEYISRIKSKLTRLGFKKYYIHSGPLHTLDLDKVLQGRKLEYMFGDFCGNLTAQICNWFHNNQNHFAENMPCPITAYIVSRGRKWGASASETSFVHAVLKHSEKNMEDMPYKHIALKVCSDLHSSDLMKDIRFAYDALSYAFSDRVLHFSTSHAYMQRNGRCKPMMMLDMIVGGTKQTDDTFKSIEQTYNSHTKTKNKRINQPDGRKNKIKKNKKRKIAYKKVTKKINNQSIADELDIWKYKTYDNIPTAKLAWITIKAKKQSKNPVMVHRGIKATFVKRGR